MCLISDQADLLFLFLYRLKLKHIKSKLYCKQWKIKVVVKQEIVMSCYRVRITLKSRKLRMLFPALK